LNPRRIRDAFRAVAVRRLQGFAALEVTVRAEPIVVGGAAVHLRALLALWEGGERVGINIAEAEVFLGVLWVKSPKLGAVR
jgi:hypothetical protein